MPKPTAIVTGASQGIGRATALRLARDFGSLVLVARNREKLEEVAKDVRAAGAEALVIDADLSRPEAAQPVVDATLKAFGRVDALLNIAGAVPQIDLFEMSDAQWEAGLALKLHGARRLTMAAWPALKATQGAVVLMSGNSAQFPKAPYAAVGTIRHVNVRSMRKTRAKVPKVLPEGCPWICPKVGARRLLAVLRREAAKVATAPRRTPPFRRRVRGRAPPKRVPTCGTRCLDAGPSPSSSARVGAMLGSTSYESACACEERAPRTRRADGSPRGR